MKKFTIKRRIVIEEEVSYNKYIAFKIEQLRKEKGITQQDFAGKVGLSRVSVVNIEKGRQQLSIKNLYIICNLFGIKSKDILPF